MENKDTTQINFDVSRKLKEDFEKAIKKKNYATMAEAFRDFMRSLTKNAGE